LRRRDGSRARAGDEVGNGMNDRKRRRRRRAAGVAVYRHGMLVRATHWINAACIFILVPSGIQILNAHPALYWGLQSTFADPWLAFPDGLPGWPKLPGYRDLAAGRNLHFFFAWIFVLNGLVYLAHGVLARHFARDIVPSRAELAQLPAVAREHARLHFPRSRRYNVIQQLSYLMVVFVLAPLMLMTGLTMSPGMNAAAPWMLDVFGGRDSARTLHFISASLIVLFVFVHIALVLLSGPVNNMRAMITGRYLAEPEAPSGKEARP
jgi:thiosulfate reductase cytochrome b subunit